MFRYFVQQNQWLMASLAIGLAVMAVFVLGYIALWRYHDEGAPNRVVAAGGKTPGKWLAAHAPLVLLVIWLATLIWGMFYTFMRAVYPPNW